MQTPEKTQEKLNAIMRNNAILEAASKLLDELDSKGIPADLICLSITATSDPNPGKDDDIRLRRFTADVELTPRQDGTWEIEGITFKDTTD